MGYVWTYTYDANGMRIGKQRDLGGPSYSYVYNGGQLMQMRVGTDTYSFTYDASGTPMTISLNGTVYYYVTNLQGDVVAIVDSTGAQVVGYTYDAWGKVLNQTGTMAWSLGEENPLRYRGYVYDPETDLYYLQSRYYDPELGRFINADAFTSTGQGILGNNMFAYCNNNPIAFTDTSGMLPIANNRFRSHLSLNIAGSDGDRNNIFLSFIQTVESAVAHVDLSVSNGYLLTGTIGCWSFNGQIGIANDAKGNIALQASLSGGLCAPSDVGFSVAFAKYYAVTNAPTVHDMTGKGYQIGGSATVPVGEVPVFLGGDFLILQRADTANNPYSGISVATGVGVPGREAHVEWGNTWNILPVINIFDILKSLCGG